MPLSFPNQSRSFDGARNAVRFLGHDGMFEVPFYVEAAALARGAPTRTTEAACLQAFDAARNSIYEVARAAYANGRRTIYILTAADFR
ncbi:MULTISPECIES: DUF1488 domain-containing protein [Sinorhizobium/Ensifer group]|uniref:DUF1488 domain-containing protein n=1 Tax=Sinorhizobium/Ensifer group TaxID=227292 RepID=UPI00070FE1DF|nr:MULTISPECIES: DUF1488 domain-containing protein [Sinorhizobium/Ensifer group]KRD53359.1 hypothetical protein ASE60_13195 [Ensifer sp. Root278]KSV75392.1 hypothetical protein N183_21800 [Sinorhizobium sp. Sb3]KSV89288.1 hypothetical protein N184_28140 [Sinorhizobium sp. GL28]MBD9506888.1 DUF1488 domain-containing protein [Ensifer sp. ENS10]MBV7517119.1 DUF1488 domain-containing protein [Ensifer sp. ENS12]